MERDIYPIGQQDFRNIRDNGALYVDKTQYIDKLVKSQSRYFFLARPRHFGCIRPVISPSRASTLTLICIS